MGKRPIRKARRKVRRDKVKDRFDTLRQYLLEEIDALRTRLVIVDDRLARVEASLKANGD